MFLAKVPVPQSIEKYKDRLMLLDYNDANQASENFKDNIFDRAYGDVDFAACHLSSPATSLRRVCGE